MNAAKPAPEPEAMERTFILNTEHTQTHNAHVMGRYGAGDEANILSSVVKGS